MKLQVVCYLLLLACAIEAAIRRRRPPTTTTTTTTTTTEATTNTASNWDADTLASAVSLASSGTCSSVTSSCDCDYDFSSGYGMQVDGDWRIVYGNGIPNHDYEQDAASPNPNTACPQPQFMKIPVNPTKATQITSSSLGVVGISISGVFIFNHLANMNNEDDVAGILEEDTFDSCNGHSDPDCRYHYHKVPSCVDDSTSCVQVGWMRDGYPIYGLCAVDGVQLKSCYVLQDSYDGESTWHYQFTTSDDCHLDEANGYTFSDGSYGYVITDEYPFVPPGYMGDTVYDMCSL